MIQKTKDIMKWLGLVFLGLIPAIYAFAYIFFYGDTSTILFLLSGCFFIISSFYQCLSGMKPKHIAIGLTIGFAAFALLAVGFNAALLGILSLVLISTVSFVGAAFAQFINQENKC